MRTTSRESRPEEEQTDLPQPIPPMQRRSIGLLDAPPKTTFLLGLFAGVAVTALIMSFIGSPAKTDDSDVKGAAAKANTNTVAQPTEPTGDATKITPPSKDDNYRGVAPEKAKVVLVEYSDFQCPYCSRLHPTLKRIVDENKDTVSWVYRHYPLTSMHPNAESAAQASECATDQGKFWDFADKLYENQTTLGEAFYTKLAKEIGLNEKKFADCFSSKKFASRVTDDMNEGDAAGVTGTPATFVIKGTDLATGQLVSGALPYETLNPMVTSLLK